MPPVIGQHETPLIRVTPGVGGLGAFQNQAVQGPAVEGLIVPGILEERASH